MNKIAGGTAEGLVEYLGLVIAKGKIPESSIKPLRIAFTKVMEAVDGENWGQTSVKTLDIDDYMTRFANLTHGKYTPQSRAAYRSRIVKVLAWYLKSLEVPGWMPDMKVRERPAASVKNSPEQEPQQPATTLRQQPQTAVVAPNAPSPAEGLIAFPFPMRDGRLAYLQLPPSLHVADATRIASFVRTLVVEESEASVSS